jgi:hypothetical protein
MAKKRKRGRPSGKPPGRGARPLREAPSPFAARLLSRLFAFNVASALLFFGLAVYAACHLDSLAERLGAVPIAVIVVFVAVWVAAFVYRFYLNRVENPRLARIARSDAQLTGFAWRQIVSTLVGTLLALCAALYASGVLDPVARKILASYDGLDPDTVRAWLSIASTILWGVVGNLVTALLVIVGRRMIPPRPSDEA